MRKTIRQQTAAFKSVAAEFMDESSGTREEDHQTSTSADGGPRVSLDKQPTSMKPDETNQLARLQDCLKDIKTWMTYNFLLLNSDQTEVILFGPKHLRKLLSKHIVTLDGITLASSTTVRNLGVIFDQDMSFNSHIKQICRTSFFHLRNIVKIRNILSQSDAEKLVHAFVTSRLDYCNSLLSGCPNSSLKHLQLIQNAAARVLTIVSKRDHISPILVSLHWLPVKCRIEFKILLLTYKALNNQSPSYLKDLIVPYYPSRTLRSQTAGLLGEVTCNFSLKVECEAEPSVISSSPVEPAPSLGSGGGHPL
ncbi:uncharacterized protein LOC129348587 [Amphiprion ocellaris]|uniref:uncharacterized protein LOC129348587 n=1 Tax=Amphiprion ocellaris TaxID=80972 RepID=UPI0024116E63|nr:uncharacterized protein LOC129348587 [Amphiprion ocellaris]